MVEILAVLCGLITTTIIAVTIFCSVCVRVREQAVDPLAIEILQNYEASQNPLH